jgi:hypothetical protein
MTAVKALTKYKLDLARVQVVTWAKVARNQHKNIYFSVESGKKIIN